MLLAYPASDFSCGENAFLRGLKVTRRAQRHCTGLVWTLIASAYSNDHCPALVMFARSISGQSASYSIIEFVASPCLAPEESR